jgi:hypothetical protein
MVLVALLTVVSPPLAKAPAWLDKSLAGYKVAVDGSQSQAGVYDSKRDFYLVRGIECDGAHINVTLTRDRHIVTNWGYQVPSLSGNAGYQPLQNKPLASLATGRGVQIGDDEKALKARLGAPTSITRSGNRNQFRNHAYVWRNVKNGTGEIWTNEYVFKEGKLIEINFSRDAVPGCGEGE